MDIELANFAKPRKYVPMWFPHIIRSWSIRTSPFYKYGRRLPEHLLPGTCVFRASHMPKRFKVQEGWLNEFPPSSTRFTFHSRIIPHPIPQSPNLHVAVLAFQGAGNAVHNSLELMFTCSGCASPDTSQGGTFVWTLLQFCWRGKLLSQAPFPRVSLTFKV